MNYTSDPQFLMMILVLPGLFGFTLIGEGVGKIMNYDNKGWVGVCAGSSFLIIIVIAFFMLSSNVFG